MTSPETRRPRRLHPAWLVAGAGLLALVGAAGFRSAPSALMVPIEQDLGWSRTDISVAVGINILLFGLTAPFAAALMERFGLRRVVAVALLLISAGAALSTLSTAPWMLVATWGVLIGVGTGSMALVFAALIADRWFLRRRGLITGVLTAGSAAGQLVFLPIVARLAVESDWRVASLVIAVIALVVMPFAVLGLRNSPAELGMTPYGSPADALPALPPKSAVAPARRALQVLARAARVRTFWALVAGFAICGATTNGLIGTHFIPGAHDAGMSETTAAGLLALVGVFDVVGTIASGWLTDRINPRILLAVYYAGRGLALLMLPYLLASTVQPPVLMFVVVYGLDWVATVPPTAALCRELFGADGPVVYGWVFAAHQIGASIAAIVAGVIRESSGTYTAAWFGAAGLCVVAAVISAGIARRTTTVAAN
ncbi:MFS transporter [Schumannella luteola]|uniref:Putative MFS family arabinose efflux permease n=1 Tax=Schumannella luteola TaxID=472059 RepID=A0A852YKP4_9MICO|nr:putative MFS family arabinose efflux permease [Schumannella luteola]TPX06544.1 MFS transporter [Schumannella luteola]